MSTRILNETHRLAVLGAVGILALGIVTRLCFGLFNQEYADTEPITVLSDRTGLLTDVNSPVKFHGVVVGRVARVDTAGDGARLELALDPAEIAGIPGNVTAHIQPVTVLGAKYVELLPGASPSGRLRAGQSIRARGVTPEFNGTFTDVMDMLDSLSPARLSSALYALAATLDGNAGRLRQIITDGGAVVDALNRRAPLVQRDLRSGARVLDGYADLSGHAIRTLTQSGSFAAALAEQRELFAGLLGALTDLGYDMTGFLQATQAGLGASTRTLQPVLGLLAQYSPELPCLLQGVAKNAQRFRDIMGGRVHQNDQVVLTLARALPGYRYPEDLPKVAATGGPACHGLPNVTDPPPFVVNDVGANPYPTTSDTTTFSDESLSLLLFGPGAAAFGGGR